MDKKLLTPGPLTTSLSTKEAMLHDWGSRDQKFIDLNQSIRDSLINLIDESLPEGGLEDSESRMMYWDTISYLTDDILCKVDRAAMANSLETRVPFLDHRVVELAQRIPLKFKIKDKISRAVNFIIDSKVPKDGIILYKKEL